MLDYGNMYVYTSDGTMYTFFSRKGKIYAQYMDHQFAIYMRVHVIEIKELKEKKPLIIVCESEWGERDEITSKGYIKNIQKTYPTMS